MSRQFAELVFWTALVCCAIAELAILRAVFSPQARASSSAPIRHSAKATEMIWAVLPAIALAALLAATWRAIH